MVLNTITLTIQFKLVALVCFNDKKRKKYEKKCIIYDLKGKCTERRKIMTCIACSLSKVRS
jgi:hypothetical protein